MDHARKIAVIAKGTFLDAIRPDFFDVPFIVRVWPDS